jgi:hypothetical protein
VHLNEIKNTANIYESMVVPPSLERVAHATHVDFLDQKGINGDLVMVIGLNFRSDSHSHSA